MEYNVTKVKLENKINKKKFYIPKEKTKSVKVDWQKIVDTNTKELHDLLDKNKEELDIALKEINNNVKKLEDSK